MAHSASKKNTSSTVTPLHSVAPCPDAMRMDLLARILPESVAQRRFCLHCPEFSQFPMSYIRIIANSPWLIEWRKTDFALELSTPDISDSAMSVLIAVQQLAFVLRNPKEARLKQPSRPISTCIVSERLRQWIAEIFCERHAVTERRLKAAVSGFHDRPDQLEAFLAPFMEQDFPAQDVRRLLRDDANVYRATPPEEIMARYHALVKAGYTHRQATAIVTKAPTILKHDPNALTHALTQRRTLPTCSTLLRWLKTCWSTTLVEYRINHAPSRR